MATTPDALADLESALNGLTDALAGGRADGALAAEEPLAAAVRELSGSTWPADVDRARARAGLRAARLALARAECLGRNSAVLLEILVPRAAYGASGQPASATPGAIAAKG